MSENFGFIKKYRSAKSKLLKKNHPSAFLILDTLAENAKRVINDDDDLLEIGEGIITAEECGLSPQQFETGIKYLENNGYIEVIHRGRKDKNSRLETRKAPESKTDSSRINLLIKPRIKPRINGTVLKLISLDIYDPNFELPPNQNPNHIPNQLRIHPESHPEQTRNTRNKEHKKNQEQTTTQTLQKNHDLKESDFVGCPVFLNSSFSNESTFPPVNRDVIENNGNACLILEQKQHNIYYQTLLHAFISFSINPCLINPNINFLTTFIND